MENTKAIPKAAKAGMSLTIDSPTSYRRSYAEQQRDSQGRFTSNFSYTDTKIADSMEKTDENGKKLHSVDSTAIASARYDPNDKSLNIAYKSAPGKEYKFACDGVDDLKEWVEAPSKGRITQEWKTTHRYPGY